MRRGFWATYSADLAGAKSVKRGIYADGDMVIILFDAEATVKDGNPYHNTYTWYFQMKNAKVIKAIAFFDNRHFDEFWNRVSPKS